MRILGLDTSTKTGYAIIEEEARLVKAGVIHYKPEPDRFCRFAKYVDAIEALINTYKVSFVVIEGYAFAGKFNNSLQYELGACIRMRLFENGTLFAEIPPTSLKKFVTGKGNAKKDLMLLGVYKRWDFDTEDDNEADAYGLAQFGRAMTGWPTGVPAVNLSAVEKILVSDQPFCEYLRGG